MNKLLIKTTVGDFECELFDCAFVDKWVDAFRANKHLKKKDWLHDGTAHSALITQQDTRKKHNGMVDFWEEKQAMKVALETLGIDLFDELEALKVTDPMKENSFTNKVHRMFTTMIATRKTFNGHFPEALNALLKERLPETYKDYYQVLKDHSEQDVETEWAMEMDNVLHRVNAATHNLEQFMISQRANRLAERYKHLGYSHVADWDNKLPDLVTDATTHHHYVTTTDTEEVATMDPEVNVTVTRCILGKDYFEAYLNYDDPRHWDVVNNNYMVKGTFTIQSGMIQQWMLDNKHWFDKYNIPYEREVIGLPSIGKIKNMPTEYRIKDWDVI